VFHVGLLKKFVGTPLATPPALPQIHNGGAVPEPDHVMRSRLVRVFASFWFIGKESPPHQPHEDTDSFIDRYPSFQLDDELLVEGEEMSCGATTISVGHTANNR
jgi:hypothetical protein